MDNIRNRCREAKTLKGILLKINSFDNQTIKEQMKSFSARILPGSEKGDCDWKLSDRGLAISICGSILTTFADDKKTTHVVEKAENLIKRAVETGSFKIDDVVLAAALLKVKDKLYKFLE